MAVRAAAVPRTTSDLSTIRRFVAFSGLFLVGNVLTVLIGMVVLVVIAPALGRSP